MRELSPPVGNEGFLIMEKVWECKVPRSRVENGNVPRKMKAIGSQARRVECSALLNDQAIEASKLGVESSASLRALVVWL